MATLDFILLFAVAFAGGAINSVAGGGTFLTFPVLMFHGFTSIQANVISTIALWPGSVASAVAYRAEWREHKSVLPGLIALSIIGSAAGAAILLLTPEVTFRALVPWLLLVATLIFTFGRTLIAWLVKRAHHAEGATPHPTASKVLQLVISVYGGYFGAGQGILMLAMLQLMGYDHIHRMNALKTVLGSAINLVAVIIFICSGIVVWDTAFIMILGGIAGGYVGARLALKVNPNHVRLLVSVIGFSMTAYFFLMP